MRGLLAILALCAVAGAQETSVRLEPCLTAGTRPRVTFPQLRLELVARRPAGLDGVPELGAAARYAAVELGGRPLRLAFDAPEGAAALGLLYSGAQPPARGRARAEPDTGRLFVDFLDVAVSGVHVDVRLYYHGPRLTDAILQPAHHRRGRAVLAGNVFEVVLVDADADGRYDGARDRWTALRVARLRTHPTLRRADAMLLGEPLVPFEKDGLAFMVGDVATGGERCTLRLGRPSKSQRDVLARRYREIRADHFRRFRLEEKAFRAKHGIADAHVAKPAPWLDLPLDEARAVAEREKKPLLAFFASEGNVWCFRYEFYTFPDREVDALLRRFVLVRIDAEKDPGAFRESGARLVPALLPLDPGGGRVRFRLRHRDNEGRVSDLRELEELISGWQRPQEFAVNLGRILEAAGVR